MTAYNLFRILLFGLMLAYIVWYPLRKQGKEK